MMIFAFIADAQRVGQQLAESANGRLEQFFHCTGVSRRASAAWSLGAIHFSLQPAHFDGTRQTPWGATGEPAANPWEWKHCCDVCILGQVSTGSGWVSTRKLA